MSLALVCGVPYRVKRFRLEQTARLWVVMRAILPLQDEGDHHETCTVHCTMCHLG